MLFYMLVIVINDNKNHKILYFHIKKPFQFHLSVCSCSISHVKCLISDAFNCSQACNFRVYLQTLLNKLCSIH